MDGWVGDCWMDGRIHANSKGKGIVTVPWSGDDGRCVAFASFQKNWNFSSVEFFMRMWAAQPDHSMWPDHSSWPVAWCVTPDAYFHMTQLTQRSSPEICIFSDSTDDPTVDSWNLRVTSDTTFTSNGPVLTFLCHKWCPLLLKSWRFLVLLAIHSNSVFNGLMVVFSIHYFRPSCMFYFLGN